MAVVCCFWVLSVTDSISYVCSIFINFLIFSNFLIFLIFNFLIFLIFLFFYFLNFSNFFAADKPVQPDDKVMLLQRQENIAQFVFKETPDAKSWNTLNTVSVYLI